VRELGKVVFSGRSVMVRHPDWSQEIRLARVPRPIIGGERVYFRCPRCDRRADILYFGRRCLLCRRCLRLSYWTEALSPSDRRTYRITMMRERLGQPPCLGLLPDLPDKPKWMRWHTYNRLTADIETLEYVHWRAPVSKRMQRAAAKLLYENA